MKIELPVSQEFLTIIGRIDRFQGRWSNNSSVPTDRLPSLEEAARTQSVGASCRMAGIRITDNEVAAILRGDEVGSRDVADVRGYDAAMRFTLPGTDSLLEADDLRSLHGLMMGGPDNPTGPSEWRTSTLDREGFDAAGRATGHVFSTLPPRMVAGKTEELLTWLEFELRSGDQHPVPVVGAFVLCLLSVSPFARGNGRLVRVLAGHLLRRAGYSYLPYASLESQMEKLRADHQLAFRRGQTLLWTVDADPTPWLEHFLRVLDAHRERIEAKVELEREVIDYPPLQRLILETVREHGNVDAGLLIKATGANRNTLKDNLRRLVQRGVLERTGQRRGTRYRMAAGEAHEH